MTMLLSILLFYCATAMSGLALTNELTKTTQCTCPGFNVIYECTVTGEVGATVWTGTAIDCHETSVITFIHLRRFIEIRGCNNGAIIGRGIRIEGPCFTSQLNITVESNMEGESVECIYNDGTATSLIGNSTITITSDPFPPPTDVTVSITEINPIKVAFKWSPMPINCPALYYNIDFTCGVCPTVVTNNIVNCSGIQINADGCVFTIQTGVCDSVVGNITSFPVSLKVPNAPKIEVIPSYSYSTNTLLSLKVVLFEVEKLDITNEVDESVDQYTIMYTDTAFGIVCDFINIPLQSCVNNINTCGHTFSLPSSACQHNIGRDDSEITVRVSGTNILGSGPANNITTWFINTNVEVIFNLNYTSVACRFINTFIDSNINCSIAYGLDKNTRNRHSTIVMMVSQNGTVTVICNFASGNLPPNTYYFTVRASNDMDTTVIEGSFTVIDEDNSNSQFTISGLIHGVPISIGVTVLCLTTITMAMTAFIIILMRSRKQTKLKMAEHQTCDHDQEISSPVNEASISNIIDTQTNVAYISVIKVPSLDEQHIYENLNA